MAEPTATADTATAMTEKAHLEILADHLPRIIDWLPESWMPFWLLVAGNPLLEGLIVALLSVLFAFIVRVVVFRALAHLTGATRVLFDDQLLEHLRKPVYTTVLLFGFTLAIDAAQFGVGSHLMINTLLSLIVINWMRALFRVSTSLLDTLGNQQRFSIIESRTVPLFDLTAKLGTILLGSYILLLVWGVNLVGWLASAGIVGIAVGFAAKDTLANLFSGIFIVADAPYKIGDYINLDTGERGKVTAIGLRSTRLLTRDDVEVTIPNGVIANAKIINESGGPYLKMRNRIQVGVAYGSDLDRVCEILLEIARSHKEVCTYPEPTIRMRGFGASSLDFELLIWIDHPEYRGRLAHEIYMDIYKRLAEENIEIPYAKQDVFIKEMPNMGVLDKE